jgi:hypothetical protein
MPAYDLQILSGVGWANGINESGDVVGITFNSPSNPYDIGNCATWWIPTAFGYGPGTQGWLGGQLQKVNSAGDAVPQKFDTMEIWNILSNASVATVPKDAGQVFWDVNDHDTALGNFGLIYDWHSGGPGTQLAPLPGQSYILGGGINNHGDVVGKSGDHGFFYSGGKMLDVGAGELDDINDNRLGVGFSDGAPVYVDLSKPSPVFQTIPAPTGTWPASALGYTYPYATAVNNAGTVVGIGSGGKAPYFNYAFVYQSGSGGASTAVDLNTLVPPGSPFLWDAFDINDVGQIVGTALIGSGLPADDLAGCVPYVASPRGTLNPATLAVNGLVVDILAGVIQDGGGTTTGGPVPPWGPETWIALPLAQREALLSFAISNLADMMSDRGARLQIQKIAAESASRALLQRTANREFKLSPAQKEQMAKLRKRMRR